jgi:DNA-binding IclR family transcriptional regulator
MPKTELEQILPSVARIARRTQSDLLSEFVKIRNQGHAVSHGDRLVGLSAVAAPIWDASERVRYCLTVNGPSVRVQAAEKEIIRLTKKAAADISRQFGGRASLPAA